MTSYIGDVAHFAPMRYRLRVKRGAGWYIFALANVAMGAVDLAWRNFDPFHQPIQAFGDNIPGQGIYACIAGALLVAGGVMMLIRRTAAQGALILGVINFIVGVFWVPRIYTAPHYLGFTLPVVSGVLGGLCRQLVIVAGALLAYARNSEAAGITARWIIGLSSIDFGLVHLSSVRDNLPYVPHWMPASKEFWVVFTGIAFLLAGIAILARILDGAASWLLGLMLLVFSVFTLLPGLAAHPVLGSWGGNAHEFVLIGAVWMFAEYLRARRNVSRWKPVYDAPASPTQM